MRCSVQVVRGPGGQRRKRSEWDAPVVGQLRILPSDKGLTATLTKRDITFDQQVLYPLFDVRVVTHEVGFLVVGYAIRSDVVNNVVQEFRQAWFCVPKG